MPRFIFTFAFLMIVSAVVLARLILATAPGQTTVVIFFIFFFLFLVSLLAVIFYAVSSHKVRDPLNQRSRFKESLKTSVTISLLVVITGILKVAQALNPINFFLLALILTVLFFYLKR